MKVTLNHRVLASLGFASVCAFGMGQANGVTGFGASSLWHDYFSIGNETPLVGDINGDGLDDIVTATGGAAGNVYVAYNRINRFGDSGLFASRLGTRAGTKFFLYDHNADGRADLYLLSTDKTGMTYIEVCLNTGATFQAPVAILWGVNLANTVFRIANVAGDARPEILMFGRSAYPEGIGDVGVCFPQKNTPVYTNFSKWHDFFCVGDEEPFVGDFDGNGYADIATVTRNATGSAYVALSNGTNAFTGGWGVNGIAYANEQVQVGDVNGDRKVDFVTFSRGTPGPGHLANRVYTSLTNALLPGRQSGASVERHSFFCTGNETPLLGNLDFDRQSDLLTFVKSTQTGSAVGDVYASLSRFNSTSFETRFSLNPLACAGQQESNYGFYPGDEPYIVTVHFRSRLNTPGSTQVWTNSWQNSSWAQGIRTGNTVGVPASIGQTTFPNLVPVTIADMINRRQPEIIGSFTVVMESDMSSWGLVQPMVNNVVAATRRELDTLIAGGGLNLTNPTQGINDATNRLRASLTPSALQAIMFWAQSWGDPDDLLGYSLWMQPVVDPEVSAAMSFSTAPWLSFTPFGTVNRASNSAQGFRYNADSCDYWMGFIADPLRR